MTTQKKLCNRLTVSRPWPEIVCYWSPKVVRDFLYELYILIALRMQARLPPLSLPSPRSDCSAKLRGLKLLIKWRLELSGISFSFKMECCAEERKTESGYRLTYQIVHWADCNAVGPSPDGGVGGTTACSGIILRVYYFCFRCCCFCAYVRNKT